MPVAFTGNALSNVTIFKSRLVVTSEDILLRARSHRDRSKIVRAMKVDLDECIERVSRLELLAEDLVRQLCDSLKEILVNESNVQHISAPVTVVGDVHGYVA